MPRTLALKPRPASEATADSEPSLSKPIPRSLIISMALNASMALVAIGMVWSTVRLQKKVWEAQVAVNQQANQFATEMEHLRQDVVTTSSENNIYLKIMLINPGIDKGLARDIAHSIVIRAREHKRDPDLVLAIIAVESHFNPNAVSHMGAVGLMQIMPLWKTALGIDRDLRDVDTSIKYGLDILASYEQMFGSLELALTAYNRGPQGVVNDMKAGRVPFNGYAENIMRTYSRIKAWARP